MMPILPRRRPSRAALAGFGAGLALTASAAVGIVIAAGGGSSGPPVPLAATPFAPGGTEAAALGLTQIESKNLAADGKILGELRILPTGAVGDRAFRALPAPGEQRRLYTSIEPAPPVARLRIPESKEWTVRVEGVEIATGPAGSRVLFEAAAVTPVGDRNTWTIESGTLPAGARLPVTLNQSGSNFTFKAGGVLVVVQDGAPKANFESVWRAQLVLAGRWVVIDAPATPFERLATFLVALVEANR